GDASGLPPPSLQEKTRTFSLGERFQLGPDPTIGPIRRTYVSRERLVQVDEPERGSPVVKARGMNLGVVEVSLEAVNGKIATSPIRIAPSLDLLLELLRRQFVQA